MGNANASSGDQFQDLAFPPDYPASVAFVLRTLKNQKDETDAVINAVKSRTAVLEGIAETLSGKMTTIETAVSDCVKKSSIQSLDPSTIKLSPASIKEFLVTMVNTMKACFALALLVPTLVFGGGKDIYGNDLTRTNKLGYVDGDLTTVGDLADFGAASPSIITSVVEGLVHPWARAEKPPTETDPTVPYWAKQVDPPAETDPTVKPWAKADKPPAETDPTVPTWAKQPNPPKGMTTNTVDALANSAVVTNALTVATTNRVAALETHVENTNNPHGVTAEQIGAVPFVEDVNSNKTAVTIGSRKHGEEIGEHSLANGMDVLASGYASHAEGNGTTASGPFSHAEGDGTTASGFASHAEGSGTTASGETSHAEGDSTTSSGYASHAEGHKTTAAGFFSHAEGYLSQTKADDIYAFAWNGDYWKTEEDPYKSNGPGTFNINPLGGLNGFYIGEQTLAGILLSSVTNNISATNPTFSNAVLAVQISTNDFAALYALKEAFADLPIDPVTGGISIGALLAALASAVAWLKKNKVGSFDSVGGATATVENGVAKLGDFFTESNSLLTGTIDEEIIEKGTAPDAHLEAPTDERLKLVLADSSVAYDSAKALPYKLTSVIGDRVIATMTLTAASTDITLPTIAANDTTVKDFILDVTNAYAVEGVATDAGINIPRTDFKLVTRDGESLTDVTTVKAGKSAFLCFTQKAPVVVGGTTHPCWCVIQLPFGDPS